MVQSEQHPCRTVATDRANCELTSSIVPRRTFFRHLSELRYLLLIEAQRAFCKASRIQQKSEPLLHMGGMMTATRRASATIALRMPARLATFMAQAFAVAMVTAQDY